MSVCEDYIKQFVGDKLTDQEINNAYKRYDKIRLEFVAKGLTDNIDKRIADRIARDTLDRKFNAIVAKRSAIINRGKFRDAKIIINQKRAEGFSAAKTLRMMIEGLQSSTSGSRLHVDNLKNAYSGKWIGGLFADISKEVPSFFKQIKDPAFDDAIAMEMGELKTGGEPGKSKNKDAQKAARLIQLWKQNARLEYNKKGGMMGEIEGHVAQSHDDMALHKAGVSKWVEHMFTNLDLEKTFRGIDPSNEKEIKSILSRSYHQLVTGTSFKTEEIAPVSQGNSASLTTRYSHDRVFHFKDHAAQMQYHKLYGYGTVVGSAITGMEKLASAVGMMEVFGTNPEVTIKHLVSNEIAYLSSKITDEKDPKVIQKLQQELVDINRGDLHAMVNEMTGVANVPARQGIARVFANVRAILSMASMGASGMTSVVGDSFNMMSTGAYSGQKGLQAVAPLIRAFESIPKSERQELAFRFGEGMQGFLGSIYAQAVDNGSAPGTMTKALNQFFKWNGTTGWTNHARSAFVRERSAWLGKHIDVAFNKLPPELKEGLTRNGILSGEWEAIRNSSLDAVNGTNYIMPDSMRYVHEDQIVKAALPEIHDALVAANVDEAKTPETRLKREKAFNAKKAQIIADKRDNLELKLRNYFYDETNYGIVMPNAKSRRIARGAILGSRGTESGSLFGEIAKSVMMYKSFSIANFDNLGRAIQSGNGMQIAGAGVGVLAKLVAVNFVGGLALTYAQDLAKGNWPPKNPFSWDVMSRAAVSGGAMGLYGDYLMNAINSYHTDGLVAGFAGPEINKVAQLARTPFDMWNKDGEIKENGKMGKVIEQMLNWTPYGNLIVARPVADAIIFDQLREWSEPGYKKKKAQRLKDKNQYNVFSKTAQQIYGR